MPVPSRQTYRLAQYAWSPPRSGNCPLQITPGAYPTFSTLTASNYMWIQQGGTHAFETGVKYKSSIAFVNNGVSGTLYWRFRRKSDSTVWATFYATTATPNQGWARVVAGTLASVGTQPSADDRIEIQTAWSNAGGLAGSPDIYLWGVTFEVGTS